MRQLIAAIAVLVAATLGLPGVANGIPDPQTITTQTVDPGHEAGFVNSINALRTSRGLAPLTVDPQLTAASRTWAESMRQAQQISHAADLSAGYSGDWLKLGENVGVGGNVEQLHQAFMDSPTHMANLLDPAFTRIGVGVVTEGPVLWTTHRFAHINGESGQVAPPPPPPTTAPPAPPVTEAPPVLAFEEPARQPQATTPPTTPPTAAEIAAAQAAAAERAAASEAAAAEAQEATAEAQRVAAAAAKVARQTQLAAMTPRVSAMLDELAVLHTA